MCGTRNFVSVRLYSAPQSHWTIVAIHGICAFGEPAQAESFAAIKLVQSPLDARKPPVRAWQCWLDPTGFRLPRRLRRARWWRWRHAGQPWVGDDRPAHDSSQDPDSPAGFLDSAKEPTRTRGFDPALSVSRRVIQITAKSNGSPYQTKGDGPQSQGADHGYANRSKGIRHQLPYRARVGHDCSRRGHPGYY